MIFQDDDAVVLAALRERGPGTVSVRLLHKVTGLPSVTVRVSVTALVIDGLVCLIPDTGETRYLIRHLHAGPGQCDQPMGTVIQGAPPDGRQQVR